LRSRQITAARRLDQAARQVPRLQTLTIGLVTDRSAATRAPSPGTRSFNPNGLAAPPRLMIAVFPGGCVRCPGARV